MFFLVSASTRLGTRDLLYKRHISACDIYRSHHVFLSQFIPRHSPYLSYIHSPLSSRVHFNMYVRTPDTDARPHHRRRRGEALNDNNRFERRRIFLVLRGDMHYEESPGSDGGTVAPSGLKWSGNEKWDPFFLSSPAFRTQPRFISTSRCHDGRLAMPGRPSGDEVSRKKVCTDFDWAFMSILCPKGGHQTLKLRTLDPKMKDVRPKHQTLKRRTSDLM